MKHCLVVLSLLFATTTLAAANKAKQPAKAPLLSRIEKACRHALDQQEPDLGSEKEPGKVCACVSSRLGRMFQGKELELLTRSHEDDPKAEAELQDEKYAALLRADAEVVESCRGQPAGTE